ncbi:hypothetical protein [Rhizorhapis sp. SPR117]|uniref:hypothetical protein n=1 Tax=Rhizorhapis sp. SPR117 TaxID=2912611 RepID=UPI00403E7F04
MTMVMGMAAYLWVMAPVHIMIRAMADIMAGMTVFTILGPAIMSLTGRGIATVGGTITGDTGKAAARIVATITATSDGAGTSTGAGIYNAIEVASGM